MLLKAARVALFIKGVVNIFFFKVKKKKKVNKYTIHKPGPFFLKFLAAAGGVNLLVTTYKFRHQDDH